MQEGFPFDGAHFEAKRGGLEVKEPKDLLCESNNKIIKMCIRSSCPKLSLFCDQKDCSSCKREEHKKCPQAYLDGITQSINKHIPTKKYILEQVATIENKFFKSLRESSNRLGEEIRFAGLGDKSREIAGQIYDRSNAKCLKGKESASFFEALEQYEENSPSMDSIKNILKQYDQTLQKILETAVDIKQLLCSKLSSKAVSKNFSSVAFDSKILSLKKEHAEFLNSVLIKEEWKMQRVERLFRASEHGFSAKAFHQKCDNQEDTLVLVRTEFGKTIGGYTHYPWTSHGSGEYVKDSGRRAFIFSLDMREKFVPQEDKLIYRYSGCGPIFGSGHDMYISDGCNSNSSSYAYFPSTYNRAGGNQLARNNDTYRMFSGGDSSSFRVQQYEVFRVWYS